MSAFYSFAYSDRVHVLADGGLFDDDGVLQRVERKIFAFHGLPMVVTGRGASASLVFEIIGDLVVAVGQIARFDDAAAALSFVGSFFRNLGTRHASPDAEFLIAAFSALEGPQHFIVPCHERYGLRPFDMARPGGRSEPARQSASTTSSMLASRRTLSSRRTSRNAMVLRSWRR
jgi:hypothetical protein